VNSLDRRRARLKQVFDLQKEEWDSFKVEAEAEWDQLRVDLQDKEDGQKNEQKRIEVKKEQLNQLRVELQGKVEGQKKELERINVEKAELQAREERIKVKKNKYNKDLQAKYDDYSARDHKLNESIDNINAAADKHRAKYENSRPEKTG
jgi:chromosome segregation ATPase